MTDRTPGFDRLCSEGRVEWAPRERAWVGRPDEIVSALASDGFQEYKHEVVRGGRDRRPTAGLWQGMNSETGAVGSAIWVHQTPGASAIVFVEIDGEAVESPLAEEQA
jgi:hypothetical protein